MSDEKTPPPPKKKGGLVKKLIFFMLLPLGLMGAGVGAGVYAAGTGMIGGKHDKPKLDPHRPKLQLKEGEDGPVDLPDTVRPDPAVYKSTYYPIEQAFTSNLADTDGFLQVGLGVSTFYDSKVLDHIKDSDMPIRSAVLQVLAEQSAEALNTPQGKLALRKKLRDAVNGVLREREGFGGVDDVYFTSFIIS